MRKGGALEMISDEEGRGAADLSREYYTKQQMLFFFKGEEKEEAVEGKEAKSRW